MKLIFTILISIIWVHCQAQNFGTKQIDTLFSSSQKSMDNVMLKSSNLPIVFVKASNQTMNNGEMVIGHMGIVNNEGERNNVDDRRNDYDRKISAAYTGKDWHIFEKRSFLIETQRDNGENFDASILGMPKENDWILYAPFSDKSLLRNALVHEFARRAGKYSSRVGFCELVYNGKYHGVYILLETIKRDEHRVNIESMSSGDTLGDALTGGYIFKLDELPIEFRFGDYGWRAVNTYPDAMEMTFQYVYPKPTDIHQKQKYYLSNYVFEFEKVLESDNFSDPDSGYNKFIDVGSFVDYMLINEITKAVTAYNEGVYFYKTNIKNGGKLFAGPFSDYSYGFNNADYWPVGGSLSSFAHPDIWRVVYWWQRLMHDKYFYDLVYTRWTQLRQDLFSDESMFSYIDSVTEHIKEARLRNFEQWDIQGKYVYPNSYVANNYDEEISEVKKWLKGRMAWMDFELFGTLLDPEAVISNVMFGEIGVKRNAIKIKLKDEYFNKPVLSKEYFTLTGLPNNVTIDSVIYVKAAEAIILLSSNATPETVTNSLSLTIMPDVLNGFNQIFSNELILSNKGKALSSNTKVYSSNGVLYVSSSNPEKLSDYIDIYNCIGEKVNTIALTEQNINEINLQLEGGVYIVLYREGGKYYSERVYIE